MPEGDTIHRLAARMRPLIVGRPLLRVWLREVPGAERIEGAVVSSVRAVGKHLLIEVASSPPRVLRTHLGMNGSWRLDGSPSGWRDPALRVAFQAGADGPDLRCRDAVQVELLLARDLGRCRALASLGPDLLADPSLDEVLARARARHHGTVEDLLLDQGVAAGIGNVFKCELLFRAGLHPASPPETLADDVLRSLYEDAVVLLRANATRGRRVTTLGPRGARARLGGIDHFVYGRGGSPCVSCGARILASRAGDDSRLTYWCPGCQAKRATGDPSSRA
jgi:endonuclease-8